MNAFAESLGLSSDPEQTANRRLERTGAATAEWYQTSIAPAAQPQTLAGLK